MLSNETRWLHYPKWLPQPMVVVISLAYAWNRYAGLYHYPAKEEVLIEGRHYDSKNGIIEICETCNEDTLVHEFRHHWQLSRGLKYDGVEFDAATYHNDEAYKKEIVRYFTTSKHELDALLFTVKKVPGTRDVVWLDWILAAKPEVNALLKVANYG